MQIKFDNTFRKCIAALCYECQNGPKIRNTAPISSPAGTSLFRKLKLWLKQCMIKKTGISKVLQDPLLLHYLVLALLAAKRPAPTATTADTINSNPFNLTTFNFFGLNSRAVAALSAVLSQIHPAVMSIQVSIHTLQNSRPYRGIKDAETDELRTGILQLPAGTLLLVDSGRLEVGNLYGEGVMNADCLTKVLTQRKIPISFSESFALDYEANVQSIVFSDGRTPFVPEGCSVVHIPMGYSSDAGEHADFIDDDENAPVTFDLDDKHLISELRAYRHYVAELTDSRTTDMSEDITNRMSEFFAEVRDEFSKVFPKKDGSRTTLVTDATLYSWCDMFDTYCKARFLPVDLNLWKKFEVIELERLRRMARWHLEKRA